MYSIQYIVYSTLHTLQYTVYSVNLQVLSMVKRTGARVEGRAAREEGTSRWGCKLCSVYTVYYRVYGIQCIV